jgi:hypothetical protein
LSLRSTVRANSPRPALGRGTHTIKITTAAAQLTTP